MAKFKYKKKKDPKQKEIDKEYNRLVDEFKESRSGDSKRELKFLLEKYDSDFKEKAKNKVYGVEKKPYAVPGKSRGHRVKWLREKGYSGPEIQRYVELREGESIPDPGDKEGFEAAKENYLKRKHGQIKRSAEHRKVEDKYGASQTEIPDKKELRLEKREAKRQAIIEKYGSIENYQKMVYDNVTRGIRESNQRFNDRMAQYNRNVQEWNQGIEDRSKEHARRANQWEYKGRTYNSYREARSAESKFIKGKAAEYFDQPRLGLGRNPGPLFVKDREKHLEKALELHRTLYGTSVRQKN